ncbi:MAG TPA: hypothetical protein VFI90_06700 [Rubrobacter sp.]|nr:hypothetical protein [Rubrobacter sp.]
MVISTFTTPIPTVASTEACEPGGLYDGRGVVDYGVYADELLKDRKPYAHHEHRPHPGGK